jgi:hypothetical protein
MVVRSDCDYLLRLLFLLLLELDEAVRVILAALAFANSLGAFLALSVATTVHFQTLDVLAETPH